MKIRYVVPLVATLGLFTTSGTAATLAGPSLGGPLVRAGALTGATSATDVAIRSGFVRQLPVRHDTSPSLRDVHVPQWLSWGKAEAEGQESRSAGIPGHVDRPDRVAQTQARPQGAVASAVTAGTGFIGLDKADGGCLTCAPPDTNGDVGLNDIVESINGAFAVYDKATHTRTFGPTSYETLFEGMGGVCDSTASIDFTDPVLLYDHLADRWLMGVFTYVSPYHMCVAVSRTSDPAGAWARYDYPMGTTLPDYEKFGVWPNAYYMTTVDFGGRRQSYLGPHPYAFDRTAMLAGDATAAMVSTASSLGATSEPMLPADLDGAPGEDAGAAGVFAESIASNINLYRFQPDFAQPAASTWSQSASLPAAGFTQLCPSTGKCVPQPGTKMKLDERGDRLMYRAAFRHFSDRDELVLAQTVAVGARKTLRAGIRWYEVRNPLTSPTLAQQATYAPDNGLWRWMPSIAMNGSGDIGVAYNTSSSASYPSMRAAARAPGDSANVLGPEVTLYQGTGSQANFNRWGDYAMLAVDPTDDCTFWYFGEYNNSNAGFWGTYINSFSGPSC
jgi:hypothetical protein